MNNPCKDADNSAFARASFFAVVRKRKDHSLVLVIHADLINGWDKGFCLY